jgi:DNA-binding FadR family transcriptional regulator
MMRGLTAKIVTGAFAPGDWLPRESDLAERFDVSRGVARECIRAMEERGLISVKHGKGATVNPDERWNLYDVDVLGAMLDGNRRWEVLRNYLEFRRLIEVEAAGLAAERAREQDIASMAHALSRMEETVGRPASATSEDLFHQADLAFHEALLIATRNPLFIRMAETAHSAALVARYPLARPAYREKRALPEHRRIFKAVKSGDPSAARAAMGAHFKTIHGYLSEDAAKLAVA